MNPKSLLCFFALFFLLSSPASSAQKPSILVLPFAVHTGPELAHLDQELPGMLRSKLLEQGFRVLSEEKTDKLLTQHKTEYLDLDIVQHLAAAGEADYALYGTFNQVGQDISIDSRLVDAHGKNAPQTFFVTQKKEFLQDAMSEIGTKVRYALGSTERIARIEVHGNTILSDDVVLTRLKMQKGDVYTTQSINTELKNLYNLGYFDDINIAAENSPQGKILLITVKEKPLILAISVEGAKELDADDILAAMSTKTGAVLNPKVLSSDMAAIRELYRKDGYYNAQVNYSLRQADVKRARLVITVDEGKKLYVTNITIEGAKELSLSELKDQLALSERGMFSWLTGSGVLRTEILDRDSAALETYYTNKGFLNARVGQPKVTHTDDGITVTFQVAEGDRYTVDWVGYAGDMLLSPEHMDKLVRMDDLAHEHAYFDRSVMRADLQKITDRYADSGYAFADADAKIQRNESNKTVGIDYIVEKGNKISINRILLQGNTKTRDNVIRREMRLADGDIFSGSKLRRSHARLNKLDFFETVDITPEPTKNPDSVNLRVKVKEKPTGQFSAGIGYSSYAKMFFSGQIQERNLFGMGYLLSFRGTISSKNADYTATFWNPHYQDTDLGMGVSLYNTRNDYANYDKQSMGGKLLFGYPLGEYTTLRWHYRLEQYTIDNVDDDADKVIKDLKGDSWASALYASIKRDTTDRRINPSKGNAYEFSVEYGGGLLGGDDHFVKYILDANHYVPLFWDTIFHLHAQGGYVQKNGHDKIPPFERFYLGGMNSVRGYETRTISPLYSREEGDAGYDEGDEKGGDKEFFVNAEYLVPLHKEMGLLGVLFFDAGNVWDDDESLDGKLYKSVGVGLRWYSPLGPLRVEYGYPLDDLHDEERKGRVEFSMGQFF